MKNNDFLKNMHISSGLIGSSSVVFLLSNKGRCVMLSCSCYEKERIL